MTQIYPGAMGGLVGGMLDTARGTGKKVVETGQDVIATVPFDAAPSQTQKRRKKDAVLGAADDLNTSAATVSGA